MPTVIKNRLGEILDRRGMSASRLAALCDVERSTISNIINDRYSPSLALAMKISRALNMLTDDIFYFEEDK